MRHDLDWHEITLLLQSSPGEIICSAERCSAVKGPSGHLSRLYTLDNVTPSLLSGAVIKKKSVAKFSAHILAHLQRHPIGSRHDLWRLCCQRDLFVFRCVCKYSASGTRGWITLRNTTRRRRRQVYLSKEETCNLWWEFCTLAVFQVTRVLSRHDVIHKRYINGTINFIEALRLGFTRSL